AWAHTGVYGTCLRSNGSFMILAEFAIGKRATHNQEALDRPMMTFGIAGGCNPWVEDTMKNGTDETWLVSNKEFGRRLVSLACWARPHNSQHDSWRPQRR